MFVYLILLICAIWWISKYFHNENLRVKNEYRADNQEEEKDMEISDELIFNVQNKFEEHITQTYLPDSIGGKEIYIYKQLMKNWYSILNAKFRYDTNTLQRIRKDWLDYLHNLEWEKTYSFLYFETDNEEKQKKHWEDRMNAHNKVISIENAFASIIGQEAVEKMESTRKLDTFSFSKSGDIAPSGFTFDFRGELVKQDKKSK